VLRYQKGIMIRIR